MSMTLLLTEEYYKEHLLVGKVHLWVQDFRY